MSDFEPKSEKEIAEENLIEPGTYDFEVATALAGLSKAGNRNVKAQIRVFTSAGPRVLVDYLTPAFARKLRHFCDTLGILEAYDSGDLDVVANNSIGLGGKATIIIEASKDPQWADKNTVRDYVKRQSLEPRTERQATDPAPIGVPLRDDDIPF